MDPLTALATITQLIGLFVAERRGQGEIKRDEFMDWLEHHRHEEIKELISNTYHLSTEVDTLLREDHETILAEIRAANGTLAQVMSRLDSLSHLTSILTPNLSLSEFAVAALAHFEDSGEKNLITLPDGTGVQFGNSGAIQAEDSRFLSDDMDMLEACGFINMVNQHSSYAVYELTRRGSEYAKLVIKQQSEQDGAGQPPTRPEFE